MASPEPRARRSYAVLGSGAIGGFYGARLARAGHAVHFVLRSDYAHVARHGLRVDSCDGDFALAEVAAYPGPEDVPPCDVVLVGLKTTANDALDRLLPPLVRAGTVVFVLQNGLGVEDAVARVVPGAEVVGGMCFICSRRVGPGHLHHQEYGWITAAAHRADGAPAGETDTLRALAADFEHAGIKLILEPDLALARWRKLVWNIPYNGLSVVMRATTQELMQDAATRALIEAIMGEVVGAATACGHPVEPGFVDQMLRATDAMTPYLPSMRLDADAGRPLELDAIYAAPLRAAREAGFAAPRIEMLHRQLSWIDARLRGDLSGEG